MIVVKGYLPRKFREAKAPSRMDRFFFDKWSPEMAWCLGVIYERGAVDPDHGFVVDVSEQTLLGAFQDVVKGSKYHEETGLLLVPSVHIAKRLVELGMDKNAYHVIRVAKIPEQYVRHVIRGILDTHGTIASFGSYLADIELVFPTYQEACLRFLRRELTKRGYAVRKRPKEIDFRGIAEGEPASYVWSLSLSRPREIIDCYKWLYDKPDSEVKFNRAQRWIWSQLHWMLRDLEACEKMLEDEDMVSELKEVIKGGESAKLISDWRE